jgi:uncharacterized LabA/DUF88 family protein
MEKQRVIVYVDGFNFYYGLKKEQNWKKYYWLDIVKFFELFMRPDQELIAVKYFSARVDDIDKGLRQSAFFQANKENKKFQLILGKYLRKSLKCHSCGSIIHTYEEKESDVRIATQVVYDVLKNKCDLSIIVSADSDMVPAIELSVVEGHKVVVYFPPFQSSNSLAAISNCKPLQLKQYESRFKQCILPDIVHLELPDYDLNIPQKWKDFQKK